MPHTCTRTQFKSTTPASISLLCRTQEAQTGTPQSFLKGGVFRSHSALTSHHAAALPVWTPSSQHLNFAGRGDTDHIYTIGNKEV